MLTQESIILVIW